MKSCVFFFWKRLIVYQKLGLLSKKIRAFKGSILAEFIVFLWNFTHVFCLAVPTKSVKKIAFFLNGQILRKHNKNKTKKIHTHVFRQCYVQTCTKFQGKIVNLTFVGAPESFCFLNERSSLYQKSFSSIFQCRTSLFKR